MATKNKNQKLVCVDHMVGDRYVIDGVTYVVRYLNAGMAWLAPAVTDYNVGHYEHCADRHLDEYGALPSGIKPERVLDSDEWLNGFSDAV